MAISTSPLRIPELLRPAGHACDVACHQAAGDPTDCTCACRGANHSGARDTVYVSTPASQARAWARIPAAPSDEAW